MPTAPSKPWLLKPQGAFKYTSSDVYLQSLAGQYPGQLSQSVAEFIRNPAENFKLYLRAEAELKGKIPPIPDQKPLDLTDIFRDSPKTSMIFGETSAENNKIYGIKVPFRYQKWLEDDNGKIIRQEHTFLDGTTKLLPVINQNEPILILLSSLCGSSTINDELLDIRNFSTDEILAFENGFFGIKVREIKEALRFFNINDSSDNSVLFFTGTDNNIQQKVDYFIQKFNSIVANGVASVITSDQQLFNSLAGTSPSQKAMNLLLELSKRAHPVFPQSVFAVALREGLASVCIEAVGVLHEWQERAKLKKLYEKETFESLFWNSGEWIKLFYEFGTIPEDYVKRVHVMSRNKDEDFMYEYLKKGKDGLTLVDLGIGTGRELEFIKGIRQVKEILAVDYSQAMLDFSKNKWQNYPKPIKYIRDDFVNLNQSRQTIKSIKSPRVFTIFMGTINNTLPHTRKQVLKTIKSLMADEDRLIVDFCKIPALQKVDYQHPWLQFSRPSDHHSFYDVEQYTFMEWFWRAAKEYFGSTPQFFYDDNTHNIMVTITGVGQCFFSHRFTEDEIKKLYQSVGLNLEEFVEGDEMYVTVAKL